MYARAGELHDGVAVLPWTIASRGTALRDAPLIRERFAIALFDPVPSSWY